MFPYFERGSLWDAIEAARNSSSPLWPFTQHAALHLFHGICSGVLALHRAGFCHRDLKPHNVMLTSGSQGEDFLQYVPVLFDFGSCTGLRVEIRSRANSLDVQDEATRKSSAPYRAPELFEPTVDAAIDGQSDVWSLGCILYVPLQILLILVAFLHDGECSSVMCDLSGMRWPSERVPSSTHARYASASLLSSRDGISMRV